MGEFYGSIHVQLEKHDELCRVLEEFARQTQTRFLISKNAKTWIGMYPSEHGQSFSVSAELASRLRCPLVHLVLHDGDLFACALYDGGELIDEYCSNPDYFGKSSLERWARTAGRAEVWARLAGVSASSMEQLFARTGRARSKPSAQLRRLAALLQITHAVTSYEYLREKNPDRTSETRGFTHIPNLQGERDLAGLRKAEAEAQFERLKREKILLATRKHSKAVPGIYELCAHPETGFVLMTPHSGDVTFARWRAPWLKPEELGNCVDSNGLSLAISSSGRFLAYGHWSTHLFEVHDWQELAVVKLPRACNCLSFSHDERNVFSISEGQLIVTGTMSPYESKVISVGQGCVSAAPHPEGRWLVTHFNVAGEHTTFVAIVDLASGVVTKTLRTASLDFASYLETGHSDGPLAWFRPMELPRKLQFSRDGTLLVMAVEQGIRVYSWEELLVAEGTLPNPLVTAESACEVIVERSQPMRYQMTYDFVIDEGRRRVLFSGLTNQVQELTIDSGECSTLLEVPGAKSIRSVELENGGRILATQSVPQSPKDTMKQFPVWQLWDVTQL